MEEYCIGTQSKATHALAYVKVNKSISSLSWAYTVNIKQQEEDYEYPEIPTAEQNKKKRVTS